MRGTTYGFQVMSLEEVNISIHVPREGDDDLQNRIVTMSRVFQSTSPVRGTTTMLEILRRDIYISIHVPREGDDPDSLASIVRKL